MAEATEWYKMLETSVESLRERIGRADEKDYHLDRFLKLARRVDEFADTCPKCRLLRPDIEQMVRDLTANAPHILREQKRAFLGRMDSMLTHLRKTHGLISDSQNLGYGLVIGTAVGAALGSGLRNPAIGVPVGVGVGVAVGVALDARARKKGRVI